MEVAAIVRVKARRLDPFKLAASSEYINIQIISVSRFPHSDRHAGRRHFRISYAIWQPHSWGQSDYPRQGTRPDIGENERQAKHCDTSHDWPAFTRLRV